MRCFVIKEFKYSHDGINALVAKKGSKINIPNKLVSGLQSEGFVKPLTGAKHAIIEAKVIEGAPEVGTPVALPADWEKLTYKNMWTLASEIGIKGKPTNKKLLIAAIKKHVGD